MGYTTGSLVLEFRKVETWKALFFAFFSQQFIKKLEVKKKDKTKLQTIKLILTIIELNILPG